MCLCSEQLKVRMNQSRKKCHSQNLTAQSRENKSVLQLSLKVTSKYQNLLKITYAAMEESIESEGNAEEDPEEHAFELYAIRVV